MQQKGIFTPWLLASNILERYKKCQLPTLQKVDGKIRLHYGKSSSKFDNYASMLKVEVTGDGADRSIYAT
jgi:hypothetical protein